MRNTDEVQFYVLTGLRNSLMPNTRVFLLTLVLSCFSLCGCKDKSGSSGNSGVDTPPGTQEVNGDAGPSAEVLQQAIVLKNRGIGHLENKEWVDAEKNLSELTKLLPQNRLALRNLAIARVLTLIDAESPYSPGSPEQAVAVESAKTAVDAYQQFDGDAYDTALADLLMGKLLVSLPSDFEQGIQSLRKAADGAPDQVDFRFALAMAMDGHRTYSDRDSDKPAELIAEFQACHKLAPENIFALIKLLQRQALSLTSKNEATVAAASALNETLKAATKLLAPFNESLKKRHGNQGDVVGLINKSLAGFEASSKPMMLMGPAMVTFNLMNPEIAAQIDQRRINKDLLEYVLPDFENERTAAPTATETVVSAFSESSPEPGIQDVSQIQMLDFDLDSHDDMILIQEGRFRVYKKEDGAGWSLYLEAPQEIGDVEGFALFDIDRDYDKAITELKSPLMLLDKDGDRRVVTDPAQQQRWFDTDHDVVLWGKAGVTILRNELQEDGSRKLTIVPQTETVTGVTDVVAADLEADGDLDLVFATQTGMTLWKNLDGSSFEANDSASVPEGAISSLVACDWDRNIAMDVVAVSASEDGPSGFLQNIFHNRFRWMNDDSALQNVPAASHIAIGQLDGRGTWDIAAAGPSGLKVVLTKKLGEEVALATQEELLAGAFKGVQVADLDNDGIADIVAWSEAGVHFLRGMGNGSFEDLTKLLSSAGDTSTVDVCDIDEDGDLDLVCVASENGRVRYLINEGGNENQWMTVVARGKPDDPQFESRRVNAHGVGSVIELRCGDSYQSHLITDAKTHLGLGQCERPDTIRILWTDGIPQNITLPNLLKPRIGILAPQILKGSCPYIYTWTGDRFEFFSDCLWAAPLGLVQANGELAPTREWENLLIPGEALAEKDGRYVLQLTEELWEIAYFDQVELTAVDHPADVEIFTNEKVGPPSMAEHRIHTVGNAVLPKSVVDGRGKDLLPGLSAQDGDYVQAFEGRIMQGLTDEWVMEFDLGDLDQSDDQESGQLNVRMFLLGWIFPTDTSLNLNIEQNTSLAPPAPPAIEVPDGQGGWKVARPFIGFPSGKTKAMVVDISDIFSGDDYRFRLRSSMELYWDHAFFTVGESDVETAVQPCELVAGDLHYRGFSHRTYGDNALFRNGRAPEGYDYDSITTDVRWPPIAGRFTKYGDARLLLFDHDDKMVVMGPGDELTVSFAVPSKPVPDGWKRDFVLRNVGYDKDADLNTIYGQSSEPFPFRSMSRYPFGADERAPDSPDYRQYVDEWQTREYSSKPFWNAVRHVQ